MGDRDVGTEPSNVKSQWKPYKLFQCLRGTNSMKKIDNQRIKKWNNLFLEHFTRTKEIYHY